MAGSRRVAMLLLVSCLVWAPAVEAKPTSSRGVGTDAAARKTTSSSKSKSPTRTRATTRRSRAPFLRRALAVENKRPATATRSEVTAVAGFSNLPRGASITELKPEVFSFDQRPFKKVGEVPGSGTPISGAEIDHLRSAVGQEIGSIAGARSVLYPASGFDAGFAHRLFAGAETVIGVDNHPFLPTKIPADARFAVPRGAMEAFTYFKNVDAEGHMAPAIIGSLAAAVPSFRLRRVIVVGTRERQAQRGTGIRYVVQGLSATPEPASHGIVEFDSGPGTPIRRYVHIQGAWVGSHPQRTWWWRALTRTGVDAILIKGSEGMFSKHRSAGVMVEPLENLVRRRKGLIVEDVFSGRPELTPVGQISGARSAMVRAARQVGDGNELQVGYGNQLRVGYGNQLKVTRFIDSRMPSASSATEAP